MKLILEDDFENKIEFKEDGIETWTDYSRVFLRALRALEFQIPNEYDDFLTLKDEEMREGIRKLLE